MADIAAPKTVNDQSVVPAINQLPSEILLKIFNRLRKGKWCTLVHVCRLWNIVLVPELYRSIAIVSNEQLQSVADIVTDKQLGHLVRELRISTRLDEEQMALLPQLFPYVTDLHGGTWEHDHLFSVLPKWKHLGKIEELFIEGNVPANFQTDSLGRQLKSLWVETKNIEEWIGTLVKLPLIEELTLTFVINKRETRQGTISFTELEKIINNLPCLHSLRLHNLWIYGELPEHISPCKTLHDLNLNVRFDNGWAQYFATKCRELEKLTINRAQMNVDLALLARSCTQLKSLTIHNADAYRAFMDILEQIASPIEEVEFDMQDAVWFRKTIHSFHRTLTSIKIWTYEDMPIETLLTEDLKACRLLRELTLSRFTGRLDIDVILDRWDSLEHLFLQGEYIGLSNNCHATTKKPRLRSLQMNGEDISDDVFMWLARTCRKLSSIECWFTGESHRSRTICYPNQSLNLLSLRTYSNALFKLTQLSETECIKYKDRDGGQDDQAKDEMTGCTRWFHRVWDNGIATAYPIDLEETNQPLYEYYKNYDRAYLDNLLYEFYKTYDDHPISDAEGSTERQRKIPALPIISIVCPRIDEICLYNCVVCN
ncbi:hypothetical protein EC973_009617 [Apophysomyces ossiformis]|uniref:F-box domain-containing protein n=1 Tax=Apophysomyces ossiformis TaxID=679940 RepID=A0A8H7EP08_9FUNG|nr:hypothetical protein EC973_009617 [Apophysomyces ossiformis]